MKNIIKLISIFSSLLLFSSCQKTDDIIGTNVSDSLWLEHRGAQMPILVEGNTASKTIILILHGGPGSTSTSFNEQLPDMSKPLEAKFGVAYWDQRLAGKTRGQYADEDFNVSIMLEDTDLVVDLLRHRYGQDISIFLLGHSWGGYLGTAYLAQSLKNQAKISGWMDVDGAHNIEKLTRDGVKLMANIATQQIAANSGEKSEWESILDFANGIDETTVIDKDLSLKVNEKAGEVLDVARRDDLINAQNITGSQVYQTLFTDYNVLTNFVTNIQLSKTDIWDEILAAPLSDDLSTIETPALLLWGKYDFVVAPSLGEEALEKLGTPTDDKTLHIFDHSGHSPMFSETEKFVDLVIEFVEKYQ